MLSIAGKYDIIIWLIVICVIFLNLIRYIIFHKKMYALSKEREPRIFNEISHDASRYRKYIFADNGSDDKDIEYYRVQVREALKKLLLFVVILFSFMLVVAIWG